VRISPIRLFSAAGPDEEKIDFILSNLRSPDERRGDIFAQFAADDVAARRLGELSSATLRHAQRVFRGAARRRRSGGCGRPSRARPTRVDGRGWLDDDGVDDRPLPIRVRWRSARQATFDFTGTAPQARGR